MGTNFYNQIKINIMKTIELEPTAFYQFKQRALELRVWFDCKIQKGIYHITADESALQRLGY